MSEKEKLSLASELLQYFYLSSGSFSKKALHIIKAAKDKNDILDEVIDLCKNINAFEAYNNIAKAYELKGAKFRNQEIETYNLIFEKYQNFKGSYDLFDKLGQAYEGEYEFEKALNCYLKAYNLQPSAPPIYCRLAQIYSKMNNLDMSISILTKAKKSQYYEPKLSFISPIDKSKHYDNTFKLVIDSHLKKYEEKKEKGYVYKPRKKKNTEG